MSDEPLSAAAVVVSAAASDFSAAALVSAGLELPEQPLNAIADATKQADDAMEKDM